MGWPSNRPLADDYHSWSWTIIIKGIMLTKNINKSLYCQVFCLRFCQRISGCQWFTFRKETRSCTAYSECPTQNIIQCPDCLSGHSSCNVKCWITGECIGSEIYKVHLSCFNLIHKKTSLKIMYYVRMFNNNISSANNKSSNCKRLYYFSILA
jgi:hypothetical protein